MKLVFLGWQQLLTDSGLASSGKSSGMAHAFTLGGTQLFRTVCSLLHWPLWYKPLWFSLDICDWCSIFLFLSSQVWLLSSSSLGFPCDLDGKESACKAGDLGSIPGLGRSPGEGKGYPLQYSGLENSMDCIVHGVAKSQTWLSDFHFEKD